MTGRRLSESLGDGWVQVIRFPLRPWLWPLIVAAALIAGLVSLLLPHLPPIFAGLLALATMVTLWILSLRVASKILLATADGAGLEREYRSFDPGELQAARQIGLWLLVALILAMLNQSLGTGALVLGLLVLALLMPGMTLMVAMSNSLSSLSSADSWRTLRDRIDGPDYRRLSGLFAAFGLIYAGLDNATAALLPVPITNAVMMALWVYGLWVFFYAIGHWLHGADTAAADEPATGESIEQLTSRLSKAGGSLADHRRLFRALEQNGNNAELLEHGQGFIGALLLAHERAPEAIERAAALAAIDPDFVLGLPSAQLKLIEAARDHGDPDLVVRLVSAYLKAWPAAPGGRDARLIACETAAHHPDSLCQTWFRELVKDAPTEKEKHRIRKIAKAYIGPSSDPPS